MNRLARMLGCLMLVGGILLPNFFVTSVTAAPGDKRSDPLAFGEEGIVGDYSITVLDVTPNANDIVAAENPYNDPPKDGNQFFIARIAVEYAGTDSGNPAFELAYSVVGDSSVAYSTFEDRCGTVPDDLFTTPELFEGGKVEINLCWSVQSADIESLEMFVGPLGGGKDKRVWFALDPNAAPKAKTTDAAAATKSSEPKHTTDATVFALSTEDIKYEPKELTIPANTDVTITVTNNGVLQHDFAIEDEGIETTLLNGGDSEDLVVNLPPGTYTFICTVPGHKEAGMVGKLIVE